MKLLDATTDTDEVTLVFRAIDGALVKAYGPGGWLEVSRA